MKAATYSRMNCRFKRDWKSSHELGRPKEQKMEDLMTQGLKGRSAGMGTGMTRSTRRRTGKKEKMRRKRRK